MLNYPEKNEVIEALITLRDKVIKENSQKDMTLKERWYLPDCIQYAINYLEDSEDEQGKRD